MKKPLIVLLVFSLLLSSFFLLGCAKEVSEKPSSETTTESESSTESGSTLKTGNSSIDPAIQNLQNQVDSGRMTWRTDPVAVTKETVIDGINYTLISNDGVSKAQVDVEYADKIVHVYLYKPVRQDQTGIWVIEKSDETPK